MLTGHYGRYYRGLITLEFAGISSSVTPLYLFSVLYYAEVLSLSALIDRMPPLRVLDLLGRRNPYA